MIQMRSFYLTPEAARQLRRAGEVRKLRLSLQRPPRLGIGKEKQLVVYDRSAQRPAVPHPTARNTGSQYRRSTLACSSGR